MSTTPDITFERGLPANIDAERTILGAVLLDNKAYAEASARIGPLDFALSAHQRVFARMGDLIQRRSAVDIVTLAEELAKRKEIESVGGVAWLASLTEGLPRRLAITEYVSIVKDKSLLRQLINVHSEAITRAADQSEGAEAILSGAQTQIDRLAAERLETGLQRAGEYLTSERMDADAMMDQPAKTRGVPIGIGPFDEMTCGLQKGEMAVVAARPSMGKSDLSNTMAAHAAVNLGRIVALFSPEMKKLSVVNRIVCARARIDRQAFRKGRLSTEDRRYFSDVLEEVQIAPLYINDSGQMTVSRIRSEATHLKARTGLDLVLVDYLQLLSTADLGRKVNREQEVATMSRSLKLLAGDLDVPVVLLAQLSREVTKRTDKRPVLSDLRESGSIEQDADLVAFLHREEYYERDKDEAKGKGEIIIAKQRQGPVGTVQCAYDATTGRWADEDELREATIFQERLAGW